MVTDDHSIPSSKVARYKALLAENGGGLPTAMESALLDHLIDGPGQRYLNLVYEIEALGKELDHDHRIVRWQAIVSFSIATLALVAGLALIVFGTIESFSGNGVGIDHAKLIFGVVTNLLSLVLFGYWLRCVRRHQQLTDRKQQNWTLLTAWQLAMSIPARQRNKILTELIQDFRRLSGAADVTAISAAN